MATLVLTALGTALGGPLGGALGSLVGNRIDNAIIGSPNREGPRLKELSVTTSSYGTAIPRHYGTMRSPGTIIWATDLVENSERSGGGKGSPSVTTYDYTISFAVALASRPIIGLGRIWADGNLLRGAAGDLKTGGELRIYRGFGDQQPDPLIASSLGAACPAFRGLAYCVFESLQLADFGNRIPALTFEIIADDGEVSLVNLLEPLGDRATADRPLEGLSGFSDEGGPLSAMLSAVGELYPLACMADADRLAFTAGDSVPADPPLLAEAVADPEGESFGASSGEMRRRRPDARAIPEGLRYYDISRDYQAGLQRADGRARPGRNPVIQFPGALTASDARALANAAAERAGWAGDTLAWRMAELDPALRPGMAVRVPGRAGYWRIDSWEWRNGFVELELHRLPRGPARLSTADAGQSLPAPDLVATPTMLHAFELPQEGQGAGNARQVYAAVSSSGAGWTGAALYEQQGSDLVPLGTSGSHRSIIGQLASDLPPAPAMLLDRTAGFTVQLLSDDFALDDASPAMLANGANRALVGGEVLQFAGATPLGGGHWQLHGLLRGRGGTEAAALQGHAAGAPFILLDGAPIALDPAKLGASAAPTIAALGLADSAPVVAETANAGLTLKPLCPVHPRAEAMPDGGLALSWTRRARGAWGWPDSIDLPLGEQAEAYLVGLGDVPQPMLRWEVGTPLLELSAATWAALRAGHAGEALWVRQIGSFAISDPLLLAIIA